MKKLREIKNRSKARFKKIFDSDEQPTRSPTPTSPGNPGETVLPTNRTTSPGPFTCPPSVEPSNTAPGVDQIPSHIPSIHTGFLASNLSSAPTHHQEVPSLVVEQSPALTPPALAQPPAPAEPVSRTPGLDAATISAANSGRNKTPPSVSGLWSQAKSESWASFKAFLHTVSQAASISGLGPIKTVAEGFADCIVIFEDVGQNRNDYDELRLQLESIFGELNQYVLACPTITISIQSICGSIRNELEYVKAQHARTIGRRLATAETDAENVMQCYQRIQDHLQRLSRNANISTWVVVDQLATDTRIRALAPSLWACYNSEKATELKRGPCTEGTRVNVLLQMREWATSPNTQGVYWMNGMAGTGKTTIAYTLCQQLDTKDNRLLCASFFCSRSLPECRSVGRIIPSVAYQIAQCSHPFRYALSKAMEEDPDAQTRSVHLQFESLILKPLSDIKVKDAFPTHMVVVIDALDECDDPKSTQQILEVLLTKSNNLPIKFVVSSRPEASIRDQIEENITSVIRNSRVVLHELDTGEVQTDIGTYLKAGLSPIDPSEAEIRKLVDQAGALFIYAATVVRYVGRDNFKGNPRARLRTMLEPSKRQSKAQTKDIDQLYHIVLGTATNNDELEESELADMKLVLNTVVCSKAPLTVAALNALLKFEDVERVNAALRPLWSVLHVVGQEKTVTTLHASFPDYLMDHVRSGDSVWHCDASVHHHILAERCLECIRGTTPQFNICQLESSYLTDNEVQDLNLRVKRFIPVELRYACRYWSVHLCASEPSASPALIMPLERFLTNNLLLWMEVMNLIRDVSVSPSELTNVSRWATQHGASQDLVLLIQDAWRFATAIASSPVGRSTPHIYVSMLPFLPSQSPIRKHYGDRMHGMVGVEGTALDRRKGRLGGWIFKPSECAACSSDCNLLAIVPRDRPSVISLVDVSSGCLVRDMSHENVDSIWCLAFSPDGTRVACGTEDTGIWVWEHSGQLVLGPLTGHTKLIRSIVYSHNGAFIITGSDDDTIRIWDANSGKPSYTTTPGTYLQHSSGSLVFDPITEHTEAINCIAASPNGKLIATGSEDRSVGVWDIQTGQAVAGPFPLTGRVTLVAISPDSFYISAGLSNGTIQIWDVLTGQAVSEQLQAHPWHTTMLTYSPDGTRIISYSDHDGSLCLFDAHDVTATVDTLPAHPEVIFSIDISPDGKHIVSGSNHNSLRVWDRMTGELVHGPLTGHTNGVHFICYSADSHRILSCSYDGTLRQWDAQTGDAVQMDSPITVKSSTQNSSNLYFICATYSPDGGFIATASSKSDVCIWCSSSGEMVVGPMHTSIQPAMSIIFSQDGMTLITGWYDGTVEMWDAKTGNLVSSIRSQFHSVSFFAFSADGLNNVITEHSDRVTMHQRITRTGDPTGGSFQGHTHTVLSAQYSPDGTRIVSGSQDQTVHIWDTQSATSIFGPLEGHTSWVRSVAYSSDGTFVASTSADMTIRIWDAITQPDSPQARIITFYQIYPCSPKPAAPKMGLK